MSSYKDFAAMTRTEAAAYLDAFLREMTPCLHRFALAVGHDLDYSEESLGQVWSAVVPGVSWRTGYAPPALGQPGPRVLEEDLEPAQALPSWFHHPSVAGYARFSAETLWLIDGAGRYLGETLVRHVGGRWKTSDADLDGNMYQNQPVVAGVTPHPVSPVQTCATLVSRVLRERMEPGPQTLADVYDTWRSQKG